MMQHPSIFPFSLTAAGRQPHMVPMGVAMPPSQAPFGSPFTAPAPVPTPSRAQAVQGEGRAGEGVGENHTGGSPTLSAAALAAAHPLSAQFAGPGAGPMLPPGVSLRQEYTQQQRYTQQQHGHPLLMHPGGHAMPSPTQHSSEGGSSVCGASREGREVGEPAGHWSGSEEDAALVLTAMHEDERESGGKKPRQKARSPPHTPPIRRRSPPGGSAVWQDVVRGLAGVVTSIWASLSVSA